jgi:hypothetical protein
MDEARMRFKRLAVAMIEEGHDPAMVVTVMLMAACECTASAADLGAEGAKAECIQILSELSPRDTH